MRELILTLPEPWSLNNLLRMSYHMRNQRRKMLMKLVAEQLPRGWKAMKFVRVDALLTLGELRDPFELPASLKIELDALQECSVIVNDGPRHLERGIVAQRKGRPRGVTLRLTELSARPVQPTLEL